MIRVVVDWQASYADPIALRQGEPVTLTGREDNWHGHRWLWALAPDGRAGWVPDDLVVRGQAVRDYNARELSVTTGAHVTAVTRTHGWTLCRAASGQTGWVPDANLEH